MFSFSCISFNLLFIVFDFDAAWHLTDYNGKAPIDIVGLDHRNTNMQQIIQCFLFKIEMTLKM